MKSKTLNRIGFISSNAIRQVLVSVFGMIIPFMVIHYSSKEIWGEFVSILLYSLFAIQIINWGNKEYLLRKFSETPNKIKVDFSTVFVSRFPLVILFSIIGFFFFKIEFSIYISIGILGRYLIHSYDVFIVFEKKFKASVVIETGSFIVFGFAFYAFKSVFDLKSLVILYSLYQLLKGICYLVLFKNQLFFKTAKIDFNYYKVSFWFFLLSILGFLASKIDVYIIERFGNKIVTSDYQIINSLLVFIMSIAIFIYAPFTKNIYRNNELVMVKTKKTVAVFGLLIVPSCLIIVYIILRYFLKLEFPFWFYFIAFLYVYPSYIYGLEIVDLFKQHKERKVVLFLFIGVIINAVLTYSFIISGYGFFGILLGSAIAQLLILLLFMNSNYFTNYFKFQKEKIFYSKLIKTGDLCFDIGANIGAKSKLFLSTGAKVIAFEPQSECKNSLLKLQHKFKNFEFYSVAVGDKNESAELHLANHIEIATLSKKFITFYSNEEIYWNRNETVTVNSINSIIEKYGIPKFCKIDTEGYELNILSSLSYKIPIIEFEFTEGFFENTLKILDVLDSENSTFNYILNENLQFKLKKWVSSEELKSIFLTLPKNRLHGNIFVKTND